MHIVAGTKYNITVSKQIYIAEVLAALAGRAVLHLLRLLQ
jgi:hypothetical protein